jgi:menaquinone-dependent protoporphyrinogen oxidase
VDPAAGTNVAPESAAERDIMCEVPIFYATTEGQTRRIAQRIAEQVRKHGLDSRAIRIMSEEASHIDWRSVRGVGIGASLHMQKHQPEAVAFARLHHKALSAIPSVFFSVSLAAASKRAKEVEAARRLANGLVAQTRWQPSQIASVAGRLAYTQYNWITRFFMRRIAAKEGGSTDTSRDHEYTDWTQVERLADQLATQIRDREIFPRREESFLLAAS